MENFDTDFEEDMGDDFDNKKNESWKPIEQVKTFEKDEFEDEWGCIELIL